MNKRIQRPLLMFLLLSLMGPITGCWDLIELNNTTLITGIAMEPGHNGKIKLTLETLNASEATQKGGKGTSPSVVQSIEGSTTAEAVNQLNQSIDRTMLISHVGIIVFDEKLARTGLSKYLDPLQRSRYIREDVTILISHNTAASNILKVLYPRGEYSSLKIREQVRSYEKGWGGIAASRLFDLTQALLVDGREPMIGAVTLNGDPKRSEDTESIKSLAPKALVNLSGMAVFRGDKLLGFLTRDESRMVIMARNELHGTTLSVPVEEQGKFAAIRLLRVRPKMQVTLDNGKPDIRLTVDGEGLIYSIEKKEHLGEVSGYLNLEKQASDYVQQQLAATIQSVQQKFGVDIFGFGEYMYRRHYKEYSLVADEWNELFARTPVKVEARITLLRSELKTDQLKKEEIGP